MRRKFVLFCMTVCLILTSLISVAAEEFDPGKTGSISVTLTEQIGETPIAGAELSLYYVASVGVAEDGKLFYAYTGEFADTGIPLEDPLLAAKLDVYLSGKEVTAVKLRTDEEGSACFRDLPLGLYFIRQTGAVEGFSLCTPFLVTVPVESEIGYGYAVNATPKTEAAKLTDITIRKVWNTDASTKAAQSVTVQLLRSGQLVETVVLNEENQWQAVITDMPESDAYSIREVNVPQGFTATYKQSGYVFTVTNTSTLIQTGQLIWPVPVLAFLGVLLIGTGSLLLKKRGTNA